MNLENMLEMPKYLDDTKLGEILLTPHNYFAISKDGNVIAINEGLYVRILNAIKVGNGKEEQYGYVREIVMPPLQKAFGEVQSGYIRNICSDGNRTKAAGGHSHTNFEEIMCAYQNEALVTLARKENHCTLELNRNLLFFDSKKFATAILIPRGVAHKIELKDPKKGEALLVVVANGRHTPENTINYEF